MDRLLDQLLYSSVDHNETQFEDNLKNSVNPDLYGIINTGCLRASDDHTRMSVDERKTSDYIAKESAVKADDHFKLSDDQLKASDDQVKVSHNKAEASDYRHKTSDNKGKTCLSDHFKISNDQLKTSDDHTIASDDKIRASEKKMFCDDNKASNDNCFKALGDQTKINRQKTAVDDNISTKREQHDLKMLFRNVLNETNSG